MATQEQDARVCGQCGVAVTPDLRYCLELLFTARGERIESSRRAGAQDRNNAPPGSDAGFLAGKARGDSASLAHTVSEFSSLLRSRMVVVVGVLITFGTSSAATGARLKN